MALLPPPPPASGSAVPPLPLAEQPQPEGHRELLRGGRSVRDMQGGEERGGEAALALPPQPTSSESVSPGVTGKMALTKAPTPPGLERYTLVEPVALSRLCPAPPPAPHTAANMRVANGGTVKGLSKGAEEGGGQAKVKMGRALVGVGVGEEDAVGDTEGEGGRVVEGVGVLLGVSEGVRE